MAKRYRDLRAQLSPEAQETAAQQAAALLAAMPDRLTLVAAGWRLWAYATPEDSPYLHDQGELLRQEWDAPMPACPWHLDPLMNVCDF